jgi:t-SNARE complex subunit (syntaxin)
MNEPTVERRRRNDERIGKILRSLGQLEGQMKQGFEDVNSRLDKVNGNIARHEGEIRSLQNTDGASAVFERKVSNWTEWAIKLILGGLIVAILGVILITK